MAEGTPYPTADHIAAGAEPADVAPEVEETTEETEPAPEVPGAA